MGRDDDEQEDVDYDPRPPLDHPRRRTTDNWQTNLMRWLIGGGFVLLLLTYTQAIRQYEKQSNDLANVVSLAAEHNRILKQVELDRNALAILRFEYDGHKKISEVQQDKLEARVEKNEASLRELERRMERTAAGRS